jgi:hypothetical protein
MNPTPMRATQTIAAMARANRTFSIMLKMVLRVVAVLVNFFMIVYLTFLDGPSIARQYTFVK